MSALNKMMGFLGLVDTDEDLQVEEVPSIPSRSARVASENNGVSVIGRTQYTQAAPVAQPVQENPYHIVSLQPRSYSEARQVGEAFREGNPVIINLDDMEESERKRLVDFASGLVFGHHGRIERVSLKVFLLSPANVNVSNEDRTSAQASFFNQS
jgi:cell division inhibitor SepF